VSSQRAKWNLRAQGIAAFQVRWLLSGEEIMKKTLKLAVMGFVACMVPAFLQAEPGQEVKGAYQPATVVSVTKVDTAANYAYNIGIRVDCKDYVARYKSASDFVPGEIAPNHAVNVLVDGHRHWMYVALSQNQLVELRVMMSSTGSGEKACTSSGIQSSAAIPAGTIIPVSLNSAMRSDKSRPGTAISATVAQDVPLGGGTTLRAGSKITGHVVEAIQPGQGSDEASLSFQFDKVQLGNQTIPITANLRALASSMEISLAQVPATSEDGIMSRDWNLIQIGGDQVSYGQDGPAMIGSEVVGKYTGQGVLAYVSQDLGTDCRGTVDGNTRPQAFWFLSVHACGTYGFGDVRILHSGRTEPVGQVTLTSEGKSVKVGKSSAMLLRVDRSGPEQAQDQAIPSQVASR
jgi:hypothetical protein